MADDTARHTAYVPHASAEGINRYLLTLLAQRRELQSQDLADALAHGTQHGAQQLGAAWTYSSVSSAALETERRELQKETTLGLVHVHGELEADALRGAVEAAGNPLSGVPDHTALLWHFRGRVAALRVERRALSLHAAKLRHAHLGHVSARALPPHLAAPHQPPGRPQCDHVGPAHAGGRCGCDAELALADQAMAANQLAEADGAERVARLVAQGAPGVEDGDWWALLHHVVAAGPGGRLHHRLLNRLAVIPLSHNHRFPLYEQLAGAARARDHAMHEAGLRVPPRFVATPEESEALLADVASAFQEEEGEVRVVDSAVRLICL
ncbi:hypothetical protein FOA52_007602 [Chlamydomonas sp. UWO 241]|nr:hypothetical protein FOA52_007602 [Chlamydomonas sp. UWO 241]